MPKPRVKPAVPIRLTLGIDEAGRGPSVGPMVIAAVVLDSRAAAVLSRAGLCDSKSYGAGDEAHAIRCALAQQIRRRATFVSLIEVPHSEIDERVGYDRIPALRAELARDVQAAVAKTDPDAAALALPTPPYDAWIGDLYTTHLRDFFQGQRNVAAHLIGSQRPLKRLTDEIENLSRYVDQHSQEKLAAIKSLVVEKDRLDFARVYLGLTKGWLFVHVPVTYALIVLTVLHVLVVYAFSSGAW